PPPLFHSLPPYHPPTSSDPSLTPSPILVVLVHFRRTNKPSPAPPRQPVASGGTTASNLVQAADPCLHRNERLRKIWKGNLAGDYGSERKRDF
ncbi:unnamed protein product, partial [Linum tenue]